MSYLEELQINASGQGILPNSLVSVVMRLSGQHALTIRASKKLRNDELLVADLAAMRLTEIQYPHSIISAFSVTRYSPEFQLP
jgi:hypothetical protein